MEYISLITKKKIEKFREITSSPGWILEATTSNTEYIKKYLWQSRIRIKDDCHLLNAKNIFV